MKIATGIIGLDKLIGNGFEQGSINLVTGKTGTGKSIFSMQFLIAGAKMKEKGLFVTTEESTDCIKKQAESIGWDLSPLEKQGTLKIIALEPFEIDTIMTKITEAAKTFGAKRVVIDSLSMFELYIDEPFKIRKAIFKFLQKLKETGLTTVVTAEIPEDSNNLSRTGVIEFLVDSVIVLQYLSIAKYKRSLMIRKMRTSKHSMDIHPFEIGPSGIEIKAV
jgi:KaiC/GvpD/RAD55 family RecA-like ATPase